MTTRIHIKNYNSFYKLLFNIAPGFLHRNLENFLLSIVNQSKYQQYRLNLIKHDKLQWRLFALQLDNAIHGNGKYGSALANFDEHEKVNTNSKILSEKEQRILAPFNGMTKKSVRILLEKNKMKSMLEEVKVSSETAKKIKMIVIIDKDKNKRLREISLSLKEIETILRGKSKLTLEEIKARL